MKYKKGVTEMGSNRFMIVSEKDGILAMNPS